MIKENLSLSGNVKILVTDKDGNITNSQEIPNLVVKVGRDFIASRMIGTSDNVMSHMAIGTGSTTAIASQTALITEVARVTLTASTVGANPDENVVTYTATFNPGTPATAAAVVEAGIFNAGSSGVMLCRTTFPVVNKGTDDTLSITWTITINAA
jgi:hypothetical protein